MMLLPVCLNTRRLIHDCFAAASERGRGFASCYKGETSP